MNTGVSVRSQLGASAPRRSSWPSVQWTALHRRHMPSELSRSPQSAAHAKPPPAPRQRAAALPVDFAAVPGVTAFAPGRVSASTGTVVDMRGR